MVAIQVTEKNGKYEENKLIKELKNKDLSKKKCKMIQIEWKMLAIKLAYR